MQVHENTGQVFAKGFASGYLIAQVIIWKHQMQLVETDANWIIQPSMGTQRTWRNVCLPWNSSKRNHWPFQTEIDISLTWHRGKYVNTREKESPLSTSDVIKRFKDKRFLNRKQERLQKQTKIAEHNYYQSFNGFIPSWASTLLPLCPSQM